MQALFVFLGCTLHVCLARFNRRTTQEQMHYRFLCSVNVNFSRPAHAMQFVPHESSRVSSVQTDLRYVSGRPDYFPGGSKTSLTSLHAPASKDGPDRELVDIVLWREERPTKGTVG